MIQLLFLFYKKYQQMENFPSKSDIINAIMCPQKDNAQKKNELLAASEKFPGFSLLLMKIGFDQGLQQQIRLRVLREFKRIIQVFWRKSEPIKVQEKQEIQNQIILSFLRCKGYKLTKIYKQIITVILNASENTWNIVPQILQKMRCGQNLSKCLHLLLAVASQIFSKLGQLMLLADAVLPVLLNLITSNKESHLIYLSIKFLGKIVSYNAKKALATITSEWMPILLQVIGSRNSAYDNSPNQAQEVWSEQFFYFHSKKWATQIVLRYIYSHTKSYLYNQHYGDKQFFERWYSQFGDQFIQLIFEQLAIKTIEKVRRLQLECFQKLFYKHQEKVKKYAEALQYGILFDYLKYQASDEELALKDTVQFKHQTQCKRSIRLALTNLWFQFFKLGIKDQNRQKEYQKSPVFQKHLQFLNDKLKGNDEQQKEAALYLMEEIAKAFPYRRISDKIIRDIIVQSALPFFLSPNILIRMRALEVFIEHHECIKKQYQTGEVNRIIKSIHSCIFDEEYDIVRIRAVFALSVMARSKEGQKVITPFAREAIFVTLQLIERFQQQTTVQQLETFLTSFSQQIQKFVFELIQRLWETYLKIAQSKHNGQEQKFWQIHQTVHRCGLLIKLIIDSPLTAETVSKIEPLVVQIISTLITSDDEVNSALEILNAFLSKVQVLTQNVFFFFQVLFSSLARLTPAKCSQILKGLQQKQVMIIQRARENRNILLLTKYFPTLRSYIKKVSQMQAEHNFQSYKNRLICFIFHLINLVYKKGSLQQIGELNITLCTLLMMSLIQNFKKSLPKNVYVQIWEFSKINIVKHKSAKLQLVNTQLLGMLLWADTLNILAIAWRQSMLGSLVDEITILNYTRECQRARLILGINSILLLQQKPSFIMPFVPELFRQNLNLVKRNMNERFGFQLSQSQLQWMQQISSFQYQVQDQSDQFQQSYQRSWDYRDLFDKEYRLSLGQIDQIVQFQNIASKISDGQLTIAAPQGLNALRQKLALAINSLNSNRNSVQ